MKLGTSLNASNIKEGDDVYFECSVNSNPRPNKIIWKKDVSLDYPLQVFQSYIRSINFKSKMKYFLLRKCSLLFQGKVVQHSIEDGIISSNQSLVLQRISKVSAGNYTCTAFNSEGNGLSNHVKLNIKCKFECFSIC